MLIRWLKFNAVGLIGVGVQLASLTLLTRQLELDYLVSTVLAVEAAILHNFIWHQVWTWKDVPAKGLRDSILRLLRFHAANGLVSLGGNIAIMGLLVGWIGLPVVPANLIAIITCALINYALSDRWVFRCQQ